MHIGNENQKFIQGKQPINAYSIKIFLLWKCLLFMSAAYIQVHFRLDFTMEANSKNSDQNAPKGAV